MIMKANKFQQIRTLASFLTMIAMAALLASTAAEPFRVLAA
jgi:hypothetical protein